MSMQSTRVAFRRRSALSGSRRQDWSTYLVVAAMALLSMVGYWSDRHFEDMSQSQEWSADTADTE